MKTILGVKLYSRKEVADLLGVTTSSITKYINEGRLETVLIGRQKFVSEENLKSFIVPNSNSSKKHEER